MLGCGAAEQDDTYGDGIVTISGGTAATEPDDSGEAGDIRLDVGPSDSPDPDSAEGGAACDPSPTDAVLRGTVFAPNLEIPISGALVYWSNTVAEPVPDGVYCAECVEVPCESDFVLTGADGTFELPAPSGARELIVTKGQFQRSVSIDVTPGNNTIQPEDSSLPGEWNPEEGKWIPRIAVALSSTDSIQNVLAKVGLGEVGEEGELELETAQFAPLAAIDAQAMLDDLELMRQYHIIFIPCMSQSGLGPLTEARIANIRQWVAEGGKWYVTDWANEFLYQVFPEYQTFHRPENPDLGQYETSGTVLDANLLAWLQALPPNLANLGGGLPTLLDLPEVVLEDNWSGIDEIPSVIAMDENGEEVEVGHHAWVEAPCISCDTQNVRPATLSAEYGCGRMMFSTYHTNETPHLGLTPQELILLYIILEIGVCHESPPPLPPPAG